MPLFVRALREDHLRTLLSNLLYATTDDLKVFISLNVRKRAILGDCGPHRRSQILIEVVVEIPQLARYQIADKRLARTRYSKKKEKSRNPIAHHQLTMNLLNAVRASKKNLHGLIIRDCNLRRSRILRDVARRQSARTLQPEKLSAN